MDINESLRDAQFKDDRPTATVERIRGILAANGVEVEETWNETCVPHCFAISIRICGTTFSVNGKGLTREFTLASGYGELMERLQLGYPGAPGMSKDGGLAFAKEKLILMDPDTLLHDDPDFYEKISAHLSSFTDSPLSAKQIVDKLKSRQGTIPCVPCYDLTQRKMKPYPDELRMRIYGSNGCAAGNSLEEAIVQGISETVERHNQNQVILQRLTLPDIPEEVLQTYPTAYKIITFVRNNGYRVIIKDCSLGLKFPVVCACFIHEQTGKYHTHCGAYPIFEIALERALTESFQGRNIDNIAKHTDLVYAPTIQSQLKSVTNEFYMGTSKKDLSFFIGEPSFPFNREAGFTGGSNKELLRECVAYLAELGHDTLVFDSSTLGFPTCQVLIPGYSEILLNRMTKKTDDTRYSVPAARALRDPSTADISQLLGLLMHLDQKAAMSHDPHSVYNFLNNARLSADLTAKEDHLLMSASLAYTYYAIGKYQEALKYITDMIPEVSGYDAGYLIALKRYLSMKRNGLDGSSIQKAMVSLHDPKITDELSQCLKDGKNPLERFTLHCDLNCTESCALYGKCCRDRVMELVDMIKRKYADLDLDAFAEGLDRLMR